MRFESFGDAIFNSAFSGEPDQKMNERHDIVIPLTSTRFPAQFKVVLNIESSQIKSHRFSGIIVANHS